MELHKPVFSCWVTLVGLDIHYGMLVIRLHFYSLCQLCLTLHCLSLSQLWQYLTEVAFKIVPEQNHWRIRQKFAHVWMKPLKNTDTKQVCSSNTVSCSMNIPAQPPQGCVKGPFVHRVTSSALVEALTHQHAPRGEGHQGTCMIWGCIHAWWNLEYQPFLAGPWHRRCDPRIRHRSVEWVRVCLEPVGEAVGDRK